MKIPYFTYEEQKLWNLVEPYMHGDALRSDAPPEVVRANEELTRLAWEDQ